MQINFKNDILPHLVGVAVFYLIVLFYFGPAVFDGKIIFQYDILQWEGAAKEVMDYRAETGEEALWTNSMFGGMPAYLVSFEIPGDITNFLIKVVTLGLPHPVNSLFFGMVAMYILLLSFKVRPEFSVAGAVAFAFNTFHVISLDAGHNAKIWAICLIPLILAGIHLAFSGKKILGLALFAFGLMLQLKFNHLQITYYTVLIVLIYGIGQIVDAYQSKTLPAFGKTMLILILGASLAIGSNLSRFMTVLEYGAFSTRGQSNISSPNTSDGGLDRDYAFNWSQGKMETLTLLVPFIYGGGSGEALPKDSNSEQALRSNAVESAQATGFIEKAPTYWGEQPGTGGPIYGGAIMLFMFVLGLIYAPKTYKYIFLSITILSIFLAFGKNLAWFNDLIFDFLPGYNKFRAVTMALSIALFSIPVLGSLGLEYLFRSGDHKSMVKNLSIALGSTAGLALVFVLFAGMFGFRAPVDANLPEWLVDAIQQDRKSMLQSSAFKSFIFILLAAGLIWASLKKKISSQVAGLTIALLIAVDLWTINKRYLNESSFQSSPSAQFFAKSPADLKILNDDGYFRVINLENPFNDARPSYFFNSIGGYHGAKMKRYQELTENVLGAEIQSFIQKAQEGNFEWEGLKALNMLNTKYVVAGQAENAVFTNPEANGPAWFPATIRNVTSNEDEVKLISQMDTKNEATVNESEFGKVQSGSGSVSVTSQKPNELKYSIDAAKAGLVVFSEIFYPKGWKALVNGQETDIIRTNYLLRGISVPEGISEVVMKFEPDSYYKTKTVTIIFQYLILLILIAGIYLSIKPFLKP
ncbi:YfhO family protein [Aquiflexum sp. TKW24L]|uniref:YfhO family protein n=1 Tax=Aquiflexum sp. TKW24L TaxID=2942212 RepID=UPI0020C0442D|nr:YfhO family protein [Aquiflexum sp. TKW24L]MCL6258780.1 YfhO family protein [Aquiflexum sp. TKW24L]